MNLQEMKAAVERRVDDVVDIADVVEWLNSAKDRMATAKEAKFPDLSATDLQGTFPFDSKYHEGPVAYAAAKAKELDSALSEASNYMSQFEDIKKEFVDNYELPPRYRDDRLSQQFTATEGQTLFTITKNGYNSRQGDLKVYVNDVEADFVKSDNRGFVLTVVTSAGDVVTAVWEEHQDIVEPPYSWWKW